MTKCLKSWLAPFAVEAPELMVGDVRTDSREVKPGDVFVATKGVAQDGIQFIDNAIVAGAVAVLLDADAEVTGKDVPLIAIEQLASQLPELLRAFYPKNGLELLGITGTNGKTTISQLVAQLGEAVAQKVAVVGTLGAGPLDELVEMNNTTPGLANNHRLLSQFAANGIDRVAMEVSSQGLHQGRVSGLGFSQAIFSNLTQDHLDYHGDMASYGEAKKALFEQNPQAKAIINIDDATGLAWYRQWQADNSGRMVIAVGGYDTSFAEQPHVMFDEVCFASDGLQFKLKSSWGEAQMCCPLYGRFNLYNIVSALAVYLCEGIAIEQLVSAVANIVAVPGRMERFGNDKVVAIVDYAHTPDALSQALQAASAHVSGKLWCIFGCGGDRDSGKRPLMGEAAAQYADKVVITNDNPRNESPQHIAEQILAGIALTDKATIVLDRQQAIRTTLDNAATGDIVLIAGKGHETYQIFGDEVIAYDERRFVRQYFAHQSEELAS